MGYQNVHSDVKVVENGSFLIPKRSDEVSSTPPRIEEETPKSSYAAAGSLVRMGDSDPEMNRARGELGAA
jgi:hypothetical protein